MTLCLQAGLVQQGMTSPSPIQAAAIPVVLTGINTAIQSYTGSGKVRVTQLLANLKRATTWRQLAAAAEGAMLASFHGNHIPMQLQPAFTQLAEFDSRAS
jgi:hypothetical protein